MSKDLLGKQIGFPKFQDILSTFLVNIIIQLHKEWQNAHSNIGFAEFMMENKNNQCSTSNTNEIKELNKLKILNSTLIKPRGFDISMSNLPELLSHI